MTGKTISTSTLGLRFMQNAQRAKQLKEVEFEKAEVKDDGQWEVPQEVRDAWGLISGPSSQTVVHEPSYLPFLFPSLSDTQPDDSSIARPKGRRTFDKKGREVTQDTEAEPIASTSSPKEEKVAPESGSKKSRIHPKPISISDSSGKLLRGLPSKSTKTARQAIYDNTGVGADLRPPKPTNSVLPAKSTGLAPTVFLKPAGVDDPAETKPYEESSNPDVQNDVTPGVRNKRQHPTSDHREEEGVKRKTKKRKSVS